MRRGLGESPLARRRKKEWEDHRVGKDATEKGRSINKNDNSSSAVLLGETSSTTFTTKPVSSEVYGSGNGNGFSKPSSPTTSSYYNDIFFQRKDTLKEESVDNGKDTVVEQRVDVNNVISVCYSSSSSPSSFAHIDNGREETEGRKEDSDVEALRSTSNGDGASTVSTKTPGIFRKLFGRLLK